MTLPLDRQHAHPAGLCIQMKSGEGDFVRTEWFIQVFDNRTDDLLLEMMIPDLDDAVVMKVLGKVDVDPLIGAFPIGMDECNVLLQGVGVVLTKADHAAFIEKMSL